MFHHDGRACLLRCSQTCSPHPFNYYLGRMRWYSVQVSPSSGRSTQHLPRWALLAAMLGLLLRMRCYLQVRSPWTPMGPSVLGPMFLELTRHRHSLLHKRASPPSSSGVSSLRAAPTCTRPHVYTFSAKGTHCYDHKSGQCQTPISTWAKGQSRIRRLETLGSPRAPRHHLAMGMQVRGCNIGV